jgi:uncharacterized membrane protein
MANSVTIVIATLFFVLMHYANSTTIKAESFDSAVDTYCYKLLDIKYKIGSRVVDGIVQDKIIDISKIPESKIIDINFTDLRTNDAHGSPVDMTLSLKLIANVYDLPRKYPMLHLTGASGADISNVKWGDVSAPSLLSADQKFLNQGDALDIVKLYGQKIHASGGGVSGISLYQEGASEIMKLGYNKGNKRLLLEKYKNSAGVIFTIYLYILNVPELQENTRALSAINLKQQLDRRASDNINGTDTDELTKHVTVYPQVVGCVIGTVILIAVIFVAIISYNSSKRK